MRDDRATRPLVIALPKGRTLRPVAKVLEKAGVTAAMDPTAGAAGAEPRSLADALTDESRALVRRARFADHDVEVLLLKPDDVPTYVEYGTADLGVCGRDVLVERDVDVYMPVDLGIGRCRLVVAGRVGEDRWAPGGSHGQMPRVASKFPRTAAAHFAARGVQVEIVDVQGSVELAPLTGLADLIVDIVETGSTLAQNGLEVKEEVATVSSLLVVNRASYKLLGTWLRPLVDAARAASASTG
ncbi:MAG: ATP phosphoribosyltransferase [Deltaproteobacteria bacterium]|nr:ATP phosphoribosyltransferase [Deltaproteobacteria bacterium]